MNTAVLPYIRRKGVSKQQGYHPEIYADLANEEQKSPLTGVCTNFMFGCLLARPARFGFPKPAGPGNNAWLCPPLPSIHTKLSLRRPSPGGLCSLFLPPPTKS